MRWTPTPEAARAAAWLAAAVLLAALPAVPGSFQFDDWNVVVGDPRVQGLAAWWASMPGIRALTKLSYAVDHALGFGVAGFRVTGLLVHVASGWLAFALLRRLLPAAGLVAPVAERAALVGALVFALHPVQTEAVTYVAGRSSALAGALALASALAWLAGRERGSAWLCRLASPALFALALAARETAVVLPLALALLEGLRRAAPGARPGRSLAADLAPHALLVLVVAVLVLATEPYARLLITGLGVREPLTNLWVQANAVVWLTGQWLLPVALNADPDLPAAPLPGLAGLGPPLLAGAVLGVAVAQWRRRRWLAVGLLWYAVWLLPGNSLLARLDVANERQLYLASFGPALLLARAVAPLLAVRARALAVTAALTLVLGTATALRNRVYVSEVAFWTDVVAKSPRKARPANNLGFALAQACRPAAAAREFDRAAALDPAYVLPRVNARLLAAGALPGATAADCPAGGSPRGADAAD
jgi:hypothetical protein